MKFILQFFASFIFIMIGTTSSQAFSSDVASKCKLSTDTEQCTLPDGSAGVFMCRTQDHYSFLRLPSSDGSSESVYNTGLPDGKACTRFPPDSPTICVTVDPSSPQGARSDEAQPRLECGCCDGICPLIECIMDKSIASRPPKKEEAADSNGGEP